MTLIAVVLTILSNFGAGMIAGKMAGVSNKASLNVGFTLVSRGEFSIIMANIGKAGGLMASIQSFAVLYVLILAVLGPILTKESPRLYARYERFRNRENARKQDKQVISHIEKQEIQDIYLLDMTYTKNRI